MISVSVIMPIYNEQDYLAEALESWANQTLVDKELICIDDGSSDCSVAIVEEYCEKYPNIRLLEQSRQGAGAARNLGIEEAEGEFVCFLDADDFYIDALALERLYQAALEENVYVSAGTMQVFTPQGTKKHRVIRGLLQNEEVTKVQYRDFQYDYQYQCFLFKREYLNRQHIRFPLYKRFQDPPFLVQALYFAEEFLVVPVEVYGYRLGHKVIQYTAEKTYDLFQGLLFDLQFADKYDLPDLLKLTVYRVNREYFKVLYDGLVSGEKPLLRLMLEADLIAEKHGYDIEAIEALFYAKERGAPLSYDEFLCTRKINKMIPENSKVVLYGAGTIGTQCCEIISNDAKYELSGWIDQYKAGEVHLGQRLEGLPAVKKLEFDYILIAIEDAKISGDVKNRLMSLGVKQEYILRWNDIWH